MSLTEMPSYKLARVIMSKKNPFTLKEILKEANMNGVAFKSDSDLKYILSQYRDNGIIVEQGLRYFVAK